MNNSQLRRMWIVILGLIFATFIIIGRLVAFQIIQGKEWAARTSDELVVIGRGRIVAQGSKASLLQAVGSTVTALDPDRLDAVLRAARRVTETVGSEQARAQPWLEAVTPVVYYTMVTFGDWGGILAEPLPPTDLRFTTGMAYYGRGVAFAARRRWAEARAALDSVRGIVRGLPDGDNRIAMQIAERMLDGEILLRSGEPRAAVRAFTEAVALEDGLAYTEPPTWYYPARHSLGKALLAAGAAAEAERVYREDLRDFPENGWSLFGLARSLERQGRAAEAREVEARFRAAWKDADVTLTASRF